MEEYPVADEAIQRQRREENADPLANIPINSTPPERDENAPDVIGLTAIPAEEIQAVMSYLGDAFRLLNSDEPTQIAISLRRQNADVRVGITFTPAEMDE